jgi:hypothetical protein
MFSPEVTTSAAEADGTGDTGVTAALPMFPQWGGCHFGTVVMGGVCEIYEALPDRSFNEIGSHDC